MEKRNPSQQQHTEAWKLTDGKQKTKQKSIKGIELARTLKNKSFELTSLKHGQYIGFT